MMSRGTIGHHQWSCDGLPKLDSHNGQEVDDAGLCEHLGKNKD